MQLKKRKKHETFTVNPCIQYFQYSTIVTNMAMFIFPGEKIILQ